MAGNNRCTVVNDEDVVDNNIGRVFNGYKSYQDDSLELGQQQQQQKILNSSQNVLLVYRLNEMRQLERTNFTLAIACLVYCGINIALIVVNYVNSQNEDDPPISDKAFHLLEFWATFFFAIVTCISLTSTPKSILNIYNSPMTLRLILFFNIVASSMPAMLMSLNTEYFEIISHQIEYLNELTMSFIDLVLLWSLCKFEGANAILAVIASVVACVQLAIYNGMGRTDDGDMIGEVPAHFLEFTFGIISSLIAFAFCMDNKFVCKKEIGQILYGTHIDCTICQASSREYSGTYVTSTTVKPRNFDRYGSV
eukprot:CAMPEP_0201710264 /NCGR_PEP_ID=MMETSP0578-20130828/58542_1 /ASSEMBLY_ACC=CAM_ASM_000663 /TAXON_ID=267565 /ORGANISM="Skeletonema grethea, Strain CCMP 1804" /LENGTH=308 /DNA_ID=CAMNT_0048199291 /DNA_START=209 /DNA_END=1135 /DNA_ORIENTATION=-